MKTFIFDLISNLSVTDMLFFVTFMVLIILVLTMIQVLKMVKPMNTLNEMKNNDDNIDLVELSKAIEEAEVKNVTLTPYEEEQEEKAIISYDELVKSKNDLKINYEDETLDDGILVKKVDLDNLTSIVDDIELPKIKEEVTSDTKPSIVMSYDREESFLKALKQLQELLN